MLAKTPLRTALKQDIQLFVTWGMFVLDSILFFLAAELAYIIRHQTPFLPPAYVLITLLGLTTFLLTSKFMGGYRFSSLFSPLKQLTRLTMATLLAMFMCIFALFAFKISADISRLWLFYWASISIIAVSFAHLSVIWWFSKQVKNGAYIRKVILVGHSNHMDIILKHCQRHNILVMGIYLTDTTNNAPTNIPCIKTKTDLIKACTQNSIDDIILTATFAEDDTQNNHILNLLRQLPTAVRYCLPTAFHKKGVSFATKWDGLPLVTLYRKPMLSHQIIAKRGLDIIGATIALLIFGLPMLIVGLIIKATSPGPMFYVQQRGGFGHASIPVIKFRSMKTLDDGTQKIQQAQKHDPRITPIGKFIRKANLDELPQLINVLKGDMSLVGPRPHALSHDDEYAQLIDSYAARHRMKPGITGWAQVNGLRGETDTLDKMEARVAHDLYYIENWSLTLDLKILALTPFTFFQKNAY